MKKVAIITGGTRGIGLGISKAFLAEGYRVVMNYVSDDERAKKAFEEINSNDVMLIKADVSTEQGRATLLAKTLEHFDQFDVLVNNAAILRLGRFLDIEPETFETVMNCNFYGPLYLSQAFANALVDKKQKGSIINILSVGAHHAGNVSYCTAKAALLFLTRCMAKELAKHDIRANSISPNAVLTDLSKEAREKDPERWGKEIKKIPMKREASAEEVASAAIYLASESASYVTGIDIPVDGGLLC